MRGWEDGWRSGVRERTAWLALAAVIALGVALRSVNLFSPYLFDAHSFRQSDTAGFALGYLTESFNPFAPSIARQPCFIPEPFGRVEAELPLYAWLAVAPLKVLGIDFPSPPYLRCVWLAYFVIACVYLYRLARQLGETRAIGVLAVASLCVLPLAVFFTVSIQPEGPSLTVAFAFLFYLTRYLQARARVDQITSIALAIALLWFKISNAYLLFPALFLIVTHEGWKKLLFGGRYWLWLLAIVLPTAAWYYYAKQSSGWSFGIWDTTTQSNKWSEWASLTDAKLWERFGRRAFNEIYTWAGIALMCAGFTFYRRSRLVRLAAAWGVGFLVFLVLTVPVNAIHIYYQLPAVVPAALTIPFALRALGQDRIGQIGIAVLALVHGLGMHHALAPNAAQKHGGFFKEDRSHLAGVELVRRNVPDGERFAATSGAPELFYNSRHSGFMVPKARAIKDVQRCLKESKVRFFLFDPNQDKLVGQLLDEKSPLRASLIKAYKGYQLLLFQ